MQNDKEINLKSIINNVTATGGATFNLRGEAPTNGLIVALPFLEKVADTLDPTLLKYINKNKDIVVANNDTYFGIWFVKGKYFLDVVENIPNRLEAIVAGILRKQVSIFDYNTNELIYMPEGLLQGTLEEKKIYAYELAKTI